MLTDTHAHLYWNSFKEDFEAIIQRALDAGVTTLINVGVDVEKSVLAAKQTQNTKWPENLSVYSTIGIHPHEADKYSSNPDVSIREDIDKIREVYQKSISKVVAVGECGLDFFFSSPVILSASEGSNFKLDSSPSAQNDRIEKAKELQIKLFQAQIDLARELNLPLIVHCRDDRSKNPENSEAWGKVLKMVGTHPTILHCYSGLPPTTDQVIQIPSLIVSFAATLTYPRNDYLREAAKLIPLDRIVLETDCPFLPPQSKRGQRNEPANILEIAQTLADIKNLSVEDIAIKTSAGAKRIFALQP